jgi:hypothetical protein
MSGTFDGLDARAKAAAILNGRQLQMLEDAGLAVIDRRKLEALDRLAIRACNYMTLLRWHTISLLINAIHQIPKPIFVS